MPSGMLNSKGQSVFFYGLLRSARLALITGNKDGIKHCAMTLAFALNHLGYTIPPQPEPRSRWPPPAARRRPASARSVWPSTAQASTSANIGSTFMIAELPTTPRRGSTVNMIVKAVP